MPSPILPYVADRLSKPLRGSLYKGVEINHTTMAIRLGVRSHEERYAPTHYRPLADEESLLFIILDDLRRANLRFVRLKPDVTKGTSLAQEVPALIQFDLDLHEPLTIGFGECLLLVQSVFLCDQVLNVIEDGLILGVILHKSSSHADGMGTVRV